MRRLVNDDAGKREECDEEAKAVDAANGTET